MTREFFEVIVIFKRLDSQTAEKAVVSDYLVMSSFNQERQKN